MRTITIQCPVKECGWVDHVPAEFDDGPSYLSAKEAGQRVVAEHFLEKHNDEAEESGSGVTQASEVVKLVEVGPRKKPARKRKIEVVSR